MIQILLFIIGLGILLFGADLFVDGAIGIAYKRGVPSLFVGLTLVAMGTSLPEAAISMMASVNQNGGIAVGNVFGSNILNILIILGICALIRPLFVAKSTIYIELPFLIFVSLITCLLGFDNKYTFIDGIVFLLLFGIYLLYLYYLAKNGRETNEIVEKVSDNNIKYYMLILFGLVMVILGSRLVVNAAVYFASALGISDRVIGLTIVALGTSLPELFTSVIATIKNKPEIAIGNIVGSNIFNILFVLGASSVLNPISFQTKFRYDGLIMVLVAVLLWLLAIRRKELARMSGIIFLFCIILYWGQMIFFPAQI